MRLIKSLIIMLVLCLNANFISWAGQQTYHSWGIYPSTQDQQNFNGRTQGVATTIYTSTNQQILNGGVHYFWVGAFVLEPNDKVFAHMGYVVPCNGCTMVPFIATPRVSGDDSDPDNNILIYYTNYPLQNNSWYVYWFGYSGIRNTDGTYKWYFNLSGPRYTHSPTIQFLSFRGRYADLYAVMSEVASSQDPCADFVNVPYGLGQPPYDYTYIAQKNGSWAGIRHANSTYNWANCIQPNGFGSEVRALGYQKMRTYLDAFRDTYCPNYYSFNGCNNDPDCWQAGGCPVW